MPTATARPAPVKELVDQDALICPGCREHVHAQPPTGRRNTGRAAVREVGVMFCHRDGSPLCFDADGSAHGPIGPFDDQPSR